MVIPTAFAVEVTSTATVDFGSKDPVNGGARMLYALPLSGKVCANKPITGSLTGEIWTKGAMISRLRTSASANANASPFIMFWDNPNQESGTFWARCYAPEGNQAGYCSVWQNQ